MTLPLPEFFTKTVYVDIDIQFDFFLSSECSEREYIQKNLLNLHKVLNFKTYIRRSSHDNVHIKLEFEKQLNFLEMMIIRSLCHDDVYRLAVDLRRFWFYGANEVNRIFDVKNDETAGKWIEWI